MQIAFVTLLKHCFFATLRETMQPRIPNPQKSCNNCIRGGGGGGQA